MQDFLPRSVQGCSVDVLVEEVVLVIALVKGLLYRLDCPYRKFIC